MSKTSSEIKVVKKEVSVLTFSVRVLLFSFTKLFVRAANA